MREAKQEFGLPLDPRAVLEVEAEATDEEIRAAYLRKVKQFPPDRNPVEFEQVRDAYELLRDCRQRIRHRLFSADPRAPLETLLERPAPPQRKFAGPEPWQAVLKEK
jgi:curved DNA-binding protein CbpA